MTRAAAALLAPLSAIVLALPAAACAPRSTAPAAPVAPLGAPPVPPIPPVGPAVSPPEGPSAPLAAAQPPLTMEGRVVVAEAPPPCLAAGTCQGYRFRRSEACGEERAYWNGRRARLCRAERWRTVYVDAAGAVVQATPPGPPEELRGARGRPGQKEVWDLLPQWRRCEPQDDPRLLGAPDVLKRYPDPDLGVCMLFRPDLHPAPELPPRLGLARLDTLHPYLADATRELVARAHAAGVPVRIISTHRPYSGRGRSSWHAWGGAFDLILVERRSMKLARAHWAEDREKWQTIAAIARELALWWGGDFANHDIFHFEWHPGYDGRLRPPEHRAFIARAGRRARDYQAVWPLFEPPAVRKLLEKPRQKAPAKKPPKKPPKNPPKKPARKPRSRR